ncbi:MAG: BlaI/MecI/CopY family transcriptional regulator [Ktedonobacteraceae bacterium]
MRSRAKCGDTQALTRRERQVIDIVYKLGQATVAAVKTELPDHPHYSTVRAQLNVLEKKGYLIHREERLRYVYVPVLPKKEVAKCALRDVLQTFFNNSIDDFLSMLLSGLSEREFEHIRNALENARRVYLNQKPPSFAQHLKGGITTTK